MKRTHWKRIGWLFLLLFLVVNFVAYNHAYQFTHFVEQGQDRTKRPEDLSLGEKLETLCFGIKIPKPINKIKPSVPYQPVIIQSEETLEGWQIEVPEEQGVVLMFHGYASSKADLLSYSTAFNQKGYSTLLVDLRGSGGSDGNTTTIGFKESMDVVKAFEYAKLNNPDRPTILFGTSMGAVSIMKALEQYQIKPDKIILECPFGNMLTTTKKRFEAMGLPAFPFAEMILFYGGMQTGFNAFQHNPTEYAKAIDVPTLLLFGAKDARVSRAEIDQIYEHLAGEKKLVVFENSEHEIYLTDHAADWNQTIDLFLGKED